METQPYWSKKQAHNYLARFSALNVMAKLLLPRESAVRFTLERKVQETLEDTIEAFEEMSPKVAKSTFISAVRSLDRAGVLDKQVTEKIVNSIPHINEMMPLNVSELRLLLRFFEKRKHIVAVRSRGQRYVTELANAKFQENLEDFDEEKIASELIFSLSLACAMKGFNYSELSPAFVKRGYKKSIYDALSIDQCL